MMHSTIYCDGIKCKNTAAVADLGYDDLTSTINAFLRQEGWEISRYEGRTCHYCPDCAKARKEGS